MEGGEVIEIFELVNKWCFLKYRFLDILWFEKVL